MKKGITKTEQQVVRLAKSLGGVLYGNTVMLKNAVLLKFYEAAFEAGRKGDAK